LRESDPDSPLHVVLVQPEIPPNTGNIARLCAATRSRLHLVEPLGFSLEDKYLKRAGLDYWPHVDLRVHRSWQALVDEEPAGMRFCFSARAQASYLSARFAAHQPLYLVFGGETKGLPADILTEHCGATFRIPIRQEHVRSLNLANAVAVVVYEALRQRGGSG
jgi:tRNA (cytidine/uridine-2'-O-)-methyltransferase